MNWRKPIHFLHRLCMGLASRARNLYYTVLGVRCTGYIWMRRISIPRQWRDITLEKDASFDDGVVLLCSGAAKPDKLVIRSGTYVNRYTIFDAHEHLEIGRNVMIGPHCYFTDADHGTEPGADVQSQPMRKSPVIIEDGVWLGSHVVVLPGVRIGRGAVIGAGSVVTKSIPANAIALGVPARVVRMRDQAKVAAASPAA